MLPSASAAFADAPLPLAVVAVRHGALGEILLANRAFGELLERGPGELTGMRLGDLVHPDDAVLLESVPQLLGQSGEPLQVRVVRPGRGVVWASLEVAVRAAPEDGSAGTAVVALQDITRWRRIEEDLSHRATHDALTGLANRSLLIDHLDRALARLGRHPGNVAVIFCDLDGFKTLNDTFGHRVGDAVLQEAASRILNAVRREDVVVRMGGDEFVVVCEAAEAEEAGRVAERVRHALEQPLRVGERDLALSASIGVSQVGESGRSPEDLVRRADLAMYRAKQQGRNQVAFFAPEMEDQARSRVEMVQQVRSALLSGNVMIELQPIIALNTGVWAGSEALVRIRRAEGPALLPVDFLRTSRRAGLVERLDARVREQAMGWLAARTAAGLPAPEWVSVNATARELADRRYAATIDRELRDHGLRPDQLLIEVPEAAALEAHGAMLVTLRRLRDAGCRIGIDDFGSGRSSLTSLRDLPADVVKIDRSLIAGLGSAGRDGHDEAIVGAIIAVAHRVGRAVVAEGVEHAVQEQLLRSLGCDLAQGHLFGRPQAVPMRRLRAWEPTAGRR